jgi:hypothetical protein
MTLEDSIKEYLEYVKGFFKKHKKSIIRFNLWSPHSYKESDIKKYLEDNYIGLYSIRIDKLAISYILPIISLQSIYFEDTHLSLNFLKNPIKQLSHPNNIRSRLARNIIREFYIKY